MRKKLLTCGFLAAILIPAQFASATITLESPTTARNDRFANDPTFVGNPYNFSAVGQVAGTASADFWVTMISPSYFVTAAHLAAANGTGIDFYPGNDPTAAPKFYAIASGGPVAGTDLYLGKLTTPVDTTAIHPVPILSFNSNSSYNNLLLYNFGLSTGDVSGSELATNQRVGRNLIDPNSIAQATIGSETSTTSVYSYRYDLTGANNLGADEDRLESGDSGGPSLAIVNGAPALVGLHAGNDGAPATNGSESYDTFLKPYIANIQAAMAGSGESITVVPEPSSLILAGCGLAGLATLGWRRRASL